MRIAFGLMVDNEKNKTIVGEEERSHASLDCTSVTSGIMNRRDAEK